MKERVGWPHQRWKSVTNVLLRINHRRDTKLSQRKQFKFHFTKLWYQRFFYKKVKHKTHSLLEHSRLFVWLSSGHKFHLLFQHRPISFIVSLAFHPSFNEGCVNRSDTFWLECAGGLPAAIWDKKHIMMRILGVYLLRVFCDLMTLSCGKIAAAFGLEHSSVRFRRDVLSSFGCACLLFHFSHSSPVCERKTFLCLLYGQGSDETWIFDIIYAFVAQDGPLDL